jgi:hypothetical protein
LNNKVTKTQGLETKEFMAFTKAGSVHLAGEPKPPLELSKILWPNAEGGQNHGATKSSVTKSCIPVMGLPAIILSWLCMILSSSNLDKLACLKMGL